MITIDQLTVQFGGIKPLDGLDAKLSAPICGLVGPNGAGKTTLLNVLSGFVRPVAGRVLMGGVSLLELSPLRRVRLGLRRTFQQELVVDELTAMQNILAVCDHVSADRAAARRECLEALACVDLEDRAHVPGRDLHLFERRKVDIAKTLVGKPKLILLDEPGAGLNEIESERLRRILLDIPERLRCQLLLIDHDADLIASICGETLVLDFGKRLAVGPTRAVLDDPVVRQAYLGSEALDAAA